VIAWYQVPDEDKTEMMYCNTTKRHHFAGGGDGLGRASLSDGHGFVNTSVGFLVPNAAKTLGLYRDCPEAQSTRRAFMVGSFDRAVSSGSLAFAAAAVCYGNSIGLLLLDSFTAAWKRYH
jgi:hypothetical protein